MTDTTMRKLGLACYSLRQYLKWTREVLSENAEVSIKTIYRLEHPKSSNIEFRKLLAIFNALFKATETKQYMETNVGKSIDIKLLKAIKFLLGWEEEEL